MIYELDEKGLLIEKGQRFAIRAGEFEYQSEPFEEDIHLTGDLDVVSSEDFSEVFITNGDRQFAAKRSLDRPQLCSGTD